MSLVNYIVAKLRPQPGGCETKRAGSRQTGRLEDEWDDSVS